jgi:hypothetical protein
LDDTAIFGKLESIEARVAALNRRYAAIAAALMRSEERAALRSKQPEPLVPFDQRETVSVNEALAAGPYGRTTLYKMIKKGVVRTIKVGSSTRIVRKTLPGHGGV